MTSHTEDSDCTNLDASGSCNDCGVAGGDACQLCGGVRFHISLCPEGDGFIAPRGGCGACSFGVIIDGTAVQGCDDCAHNDAGFLDAEDIVRDDLAVAFTEKALRMLFDIQQIVIGSEETHGGSITKYDQIADRLWRAGFISNRFRKGMPIVLTADRDTVGKVIGVHRQGVNVEWADGFQEVISNASLADISPRD